MYTIADFWSYYWHGVLQQKSKKSQQSESARWQYILNFFGSDCVIDKITPLALLQFQATIRHLSPQSVAHCLSLLRRVINYAINIELYAGICPKIKMPKFDNRRLRFLSREEAKELLADLRRRSLLWHDIVLVALNTGLRAGEIFNLQFTDFDQDNNVIYVKKTKNLKNRTVPLNFIAFEALKRQASQSNYIFLERDKKIRAAGRTFRFAVKNCGLNPPGTDRLNRVVFHSLRHTFASWLVQDGIPLAVVSQLLGHSSINITMRYAHLAPNQGKAAVETIARRLTD